MVSVNNLSIHFTGVDLFSDVSFIVNPRDRIGLTGKNGAGKSTLLKILANQLKPETGQVSWPSGCTLGYLPQEMMPNATKSILAEAMEAFEEIIALGEKSEKIAIELAEREDYESEEYLKSIERLHEVQERYSLMGGHTMQADTEKVLLGLGFEHSDFHRPMTEFSSGWQMRVELAKILLRKPDLLLLDEPTNHLDIVSITWLEDWLESYPGGLVLVSHDRAFLDNVTNRTIEIMNARVYDYKAGYSDYVHLRAEQMNVQMAALENQQRQIAQIERFVERFRYKSTKARQVQSRVKMLEKMETIEVDSFDKSSIRFRFPQAPHAGKVIFDAENVIKSYGSHNVLNNLSFKVINSDKIAFVGRNGEGKTTLSRILTGEIDFEGVIIPGHQVKIGYFAQNQAAMLDGEKTVFETLDQIAVGEVRTQIRAILGSFLFGTDAIDKKVKVLSGGEKTRLALAKLLLTPSNVLILDEPTNHLDMLSKDILKNALLEFNGTLIIVSHDRDFLQGLTNRVFEFRNKRIYEHLGDVYDFLESRKIDSLKALENAALVESAKRSETNLSDNQLYREKKKALDREKRRVTQQIEEIELIISSLESTLAKMDSLIAEPSATNVHTASFYQEYEELRKKLQKSMHEWETLHQQIEEIDNSDV